MMGEPCCDRPNLVGDGRVKRCTNCDGFFVGELRAAEPVAARKPPPVKKPKPKAAAKPKPATPPSPPEPAPAPRPTARSLSEEREIRLARRRARMEAPHYARCGQRDMHWPGCPNEGTDARTVVGPEHRVPAC